MLVRLSRIVRISSPIALGSLVALSILGVIVSLVSLVILIILDILVNVGRQSTLLSLARLELRENIAAVSKLRSLPSTPRGVRMESLTGRTSPARLYRLTITTGGGKSP